jgi:hypothetical protein
MLKSIALAAAVAAVALPAAAQPSTGGPTPNEERGMYIGDTTANGSATIVTDRTGTHPDGFTGMAVQNHIAGDGDASHAHRHHHPRHPASGTSPG